MADDALVSLTLIAAEGSIAEEPAAAIQFERPDETLAGGALHVAFPPARNFHVPAWPDVNALVCDVTMSRHRPMRSSVCIPRSNEPTELTANAIRDPDMWTPSFRSFDSLTSARFSRLLEVVKASTAVALKNGAAIGDLATAYDTLSSDQAMLAKMALLNLYAVTTDEQDPIARDAWISAVKEFLLIDRERFVARIDSWLFDDVAAIETRIDQYRSEGFFTELSSSQHLDNIPAAYTLDGELFSVKVRYQQGNLQLTVAKTQHDDLPAYLLDCDLDEHSNLLFHTIDMFEHIFTGGTHPIDMHEYIMRDSVPAGGLSTLDLGYTLEPVA